ncbi:hypothetical protein AC629_01775 [Bradyrhizobium sp. NAS80.1]|nr:hypothetical protein AC629_01775 [Bradyrhizobium sp. NAS80.1]
MAILSSNPTFSPWLRPRCSSPRLLKSGSGVTKELAGSHSEPARFETAFIRAHRFRSWDRLIDTDAADSAPIKQEQIMIVTGDVLIEETGLRRD